MQPAWRDAIMHYVFWEGFDAWSPQNIQAVADDITVNKAQALRDLAPDSGAYFNEVSEIKMERRLVEEVCRFHMADCQNLHI
jgi:hypothetical protein